MSSNHVRPTVGRGRSRLGRRYRNTSLELLEGRVLLSGDPTGGPSPYDMGTPTLRDIWVDPSRGSDSAGGADRAHALLTFSAAWNSIPADAPPTTGYRIMLAAGNYDPNNLTSDGWTSDRRGTARYPVEIVSADGDNAAVLHRGMDFQNDSYLYLIGLKFVTDPGADGGGNVVHVAASDHVLIRDCSLNGSDGTTRLAQETLKVNQVQDIWVEHSDIQGAFWFGLDFVAVEYGHVIGNAIHETGDDALVLKGGTAQILVQGNHVYDGGVTGITAGQGSGFEFMVAPWIHYEAYDLKIVDNVIDHIQNAGLAVRGGYNILMADNTLYKVGLNQDSGSGLILVGHGSRSLDNPDDSAVVARYHAAGGWGPTVQGDGSDPGEYIPNKHVYIVNNVIDNPDGVQTLYSQFDVADPATPPAGWNIPSPSSATDDLQIRGNLIWNGAAGKDLGINDPALAAQVARDNAINTLRPDLVDPERGNFAPVAGGVIARTAGPPIPAFPGTGLPARAAEPAGNLVNAVALDATGRFRAIASPPGAFDPNATTVPPAPSPAPAPAPSPSPTPLDRMTSAANALIHSPSTTTGLVAASYRRLLGRGPTAAESSSWAGQFARGTTTEEKLASSLIGSPEYARRAGHGDRGWINAAFRDVLGRAPTSAEANGWLAQLGHGASRSTLTAQLESGREARSAAINAAYSRTLGRPPRADELTRWLGVLASNQGDRRAIAVGLVASAEFYNAHGSTFDSWSTAARSALAKYGQA